ncbi:preprotein translocase subunit SecG [Candidatus Gribaldobacteria bacterium]|nr:preprotein translocase subunit SecG [Candidatus Gribaldobacteria bacterium]
MNNILTILQVITSVALIALVLLQKRGTALGSAFGGSESGSYLKRRGMEKMIVILTIVFAIVFALLALLNLVF